MNVTLFKDLTTDEHLTELEANSEEYNGLYVDMEVAEQRKYVKGKAADIKDIIKRVNSARIKKSKDYRILVEAEAVSIIARLEKANEPFTLLIDDYDAARKVILDAEKASKLAIENTAQKLIDHEFAILLDKSYLADKLEAERLQREHDEKIKVEAEENVRLSIIRAKEVTDRAIELDAANRLANKEHVRSVNRTILAALVSHGVSDEDARWIIALAAKGKLPHLTINY
tara:strand:- start:188 stop:874 length:687 start_codon:yes stop_codon:yes gene_type:complete